MIPAGLPCYCLAALMRLSHRQKSVVMALIVLVVIMLMLALAEGAVQLRQYFKSGYSGNISELLRDEDGLRVLIPDVDSRTISINSLGFRGPPISQEDAVGNLRIAFVGASTTFCAEVSGNDMTWPHLVSADIRQQYPDIQTDYVNAAVPGYTVKTSLKNFRRRVAPLSPDITIIYHATNDLSWETRKLAAEQGIYDADEEGKGGWLARHSSLLYLVLKNLSIKEAQDNAGGERELLEFSAAELGGNFRKYLTKLVREAQSVSEVVALVTFSQQIRPEQTPEQQLAASVSSTYYMPFMNPAGLMDAYARYNRIIAEVAGETGALLIDGEMMIPGDSEHFNDTVHFKDAGSRVMARRVSQALMESPEFKYLAEEKRGTN